MDENLTKEALTAFVDAINATGGVTVDKKGYTVPVGDQEWIDLGMAYEKACQALGVQPQVNDALADDLDEVEFCESCGERPTDYGDEHEAGCADAGKKMCKLHHTCTEEDDNAQQG